MTIKFVCSCGKHLKARDEMAARRSVCPRCGSPVGIPSLKPTHAGTTAAPLTPHERLRKGRQQAPATGPATPAPEAPSAPPKQVDSPLVHLLSSRSVRRVRRTERHLEKHWDEFLLYPLRAWRLFLSLALFLTLLSVGVAFVLPQMLAQQTSQPAILAGVRLGCAVLLVLIVGIPCSFLDCVLVSAVGGEVYYILWSGSPLTVVLRSGLKWLTCFVAGPIVFAAAGWYYWLQCGDATTLDYLILVEVWVVAVAYWVFALLSLTDRGRLRDLNPLVVTDVAHRLGWRAMLVVVGAALLLLAHGWILTTGVAEVHTEPVQGLSLLVGGWMSAMYWSTFFCRLLGVWCHRKRLGLRR